MPCNLDHDLKTAAASFPVWVPLGKDDTLDKRMWLVVHGTGEYAISDPHVRFLGEGKEEWLFSDPATAMHFKIKFG